LRADLISGHRYFVIPARMLGTALWALVGLALFAPASAGAQSRTLGSPLTAEPNLNLGCETRLALGDDGGTGNYYASPSNQPDCTWRQQGVFGVTDYNQDGRTSSVPGTGRITNIAVRSGPNPGLIRFVILRELLCPSTTCAVGGPGAVGGSTGGSYCCYFVEEGPIVRPTPNAITNFPTNFLVQRNADSNNVLAADHVAISGVSGTGSLPLSSNGRNNAFYYTQRGSPNASFWYPRMGGLPNDPAAGRREEGAIPGVEILMRWTWCPAGQTCAGPAPGGPAPGPGGPAVPGPGPAAAAPTVTSFGVTPTRFAVGPGTTPTAAARGRAARGATLRFGLSSPGSIAIAFERALAGRRSGTSCRPPSSALRRARACVRYLRAGALQRSNLPAGSSSLRFSGRIGRRALTPGRYRATIAAGTAGRPGRPRTAGFEILRG
jgi:hypothetical protein